VDHDFIRDLFAPFGAVTVRRMFSGAGLFADGLMFALVVRDVIYLKVDNANRRDFEREGCAPFTYTRGKKSGRPSQRALPYWRLPERLYDDPDELALWARRAFAAAERKKFAPRNRASESRPQDGLGEAIIRRVEIKVEISKADFATLSVLRASLTEIR
jgi:DNA transformation protein and related proteins